ncbi:MAG: LPS export ABC transporter periplasmic protein LptC [Ignavibacteriales bacterium]|nr:LPS export ABC transporter periplasmic protein LptC [Ignavibacteriales bacterium]
MKKNIIILFIFITLQIFAQDKHKQITITGDSLKGKLIEGENFREVIGNVVITQDDVIITCLKAIQNISKNSAVLIGNVVVKQDSVVITTEKGNYYGNEKITTSDTLVHLQNNSTNLIANTGLYNLETKIAEFNGDVLFYDSVTTLRSQKLIYEKEIEKIIATKNVEVSDSVSKINADSLIHLRNTKLSEGYGDVKIYSKENNVTISGKQLLDDKQNNISKIFGDPFLIQIEALSDSTYDTLYIQSKYMEAKSDSGSKLIAIDSVKIIRGDFLSNNDYTIYDKAVEEITILKQNEKPVPILWYENTQITGDSLYIHLDSSKIKNVEIIKNAIMISQDSVYQFRYNQMSGDTIYLYFNDGDLSQTNVNGNVLSIYYLFDEKEPNGLLKSSGEKFKIFIADNKVTDVKLYGSPVSEYHPENLVKGNEKSFTLPTFILYSNKPDKKKFENMFFEINKN